MRTEYQVKIEGALSPEDLLARGAVPMGRSDHVDIYLAGDGIRCIRTDGERYHYTYTSDELSMESFVRVRRVEDDFLDRHEVKSLRHQCGELLRVDKKRELFRVGEAIVAIDEVRDLGNFIEIAASDEIEIRRTIQVLGLENKQTIKRTYLDLMREQKLSPFRIKLGRWHGKLGVLTFGIVSGVLTTLGLLVGVVCSGASLSAILAGILGIALADSVSDAFGMFLSKKADGVKTTVALRNALGTFLGKLILPLTFVIPFLVTSVTVATWSALVWGALLLALVSAEQAYIGSKSVVGYVFRYLSIGVAIVLVTGFAGHLISIYIG